MVKKILLVLAVLVAIGVCTGIFLWYKPHEKVENKKGIAVTATALAAEYNTDEKQADVKYLQKALEVSGTISDVQTNQDGGLAVVLDAGDPMNSVQCTMREKNVKLAKGQTVTLKGFCTGHSILGVSLTDCIIKKDE